MEIQLTQSPTAGVDTVDPSPHSSLVSSSAVWRSQRTTTRMPHNHNLDVPSADATSQGRGRFGYKDRDR